MNLKHYGICFKLKGGPELLDYIQSNQPVPVDLMGQVMNQMDTVSPEELKFAGRLEADWKKCLNEQAPMTMTVAKDGGYDITCTVDDGLLDVIRLLTGKENEKIIEEYTAAYLKEVCGMDADIISVGVEETIKAEPAKQAEQASGFDLGALTEDPNEPEMEDISGIDPTDLGLDEEPEDIPVEGFEAAAEEAVPVEDGIPVEGPDEEDLYDGEIPEDEIPEDEIPEDEIPEDEVPMEEEVPEDGAPGMNNAVAGIYREMVSNIRDRKLDEKLGLTIGGNR